MDMDAETFLQRQQRPPGHSFQPESLPQHQPQQQQQQQQQQQHEAWQPPNLTPIEVNSQTPSAATNQYHVPSPSSPSEGYFHQGQQHHSQQQDVYTPTSATSTTRPSTGLSLNIAGLSVESATPSPLTGGPSPFAVHAPSHPQMYPAHANPAGLQPQQQFAQNDAVFTFAAPSPKHEWVEPPPIGRSQSSSALLHSVAISHPQSAHQQSQYTPNTLRPSSSMSSMPEYDHNSQHFYSHHAQHNAQRSHHELQYPSYSDGQRTHYPQQEHAQVLHHYPSFSSSATDDLTPNSNTAQSTFARDFDGQSPQHERDNHVGSPIGQDDEVYESSRPPRSSSGSSEPYEESVVFHAHGVNAETASALPTIGSNSSGGGPSLTANIKRESAHPESSMSLSSSSSASGLTISPSGVARPGTSKGTGNIPTNNFVAKLYTMITDPRSAQYITWNDLGTSFIVSNTGEFSRTILGSHFKHSNFSSFVRQLNMYGFHKINRTPRSARANSENQEWEFSHPKFLRGRADLIEEIKRRNVDPNDPASSSLRPGTSGTSGRVDLPHELAATLQRVDSNHDQLVRAFWTERLRVEKLSGVVKDMHALLAKLCPSTENGPSLPPFPEGLLNHTSDGADTAAAPGILVTSPTEPSPPANMHFQGLNMINSQTQSQWGDIPLSQSLSTISPSSSPTSAEFPQKSRLSGQTIPPSMRRTPPSRMNIPALPRFESGSTSAAGPRGGFASRPQRKLSLPSQGGILMEDGETDIASDENGRIDEPRIEGRSVSAKRQRMNPGFGVNVTRANTAILSPDTHSSPSPGAGTFSGPPSSASSTTPSGTSFASTDGGINNFNPKQFGMSITIPPAPLQSPRSTSRLVSSAFAGTTGHVRTLARARSDSAPHGVGLGNLWRVNGSDALGYGYAHVGGGRPRSGTHHPYAASQSFHHSRASISGAGGVARSPSLASIGASGESSTNQSKPPPGQTQTIPATSSLQHHDTVTSMMVQKPA